MDAGWPGFENRDANRIRHVLPGEKRTRSTTILHFHRDHSGGLKQLAANRRDRYGSSTTATASAGQAGGKALWNDYLGSPKARPDDRAGRRAAADRRLIDLRRRPQQRAPEPLGSGPRNPHCEGARRSRKGDRERQERRVRGQDGRVRVPEPRGPHLELRARAGVSGEPDRRGRPLSDNAPPAVIGRAAVGEGGPADRGRDEQRSAQGRQPGRLEGPAAGRWLHSGGLTQLSKPRIVDRDRDTSAKPIAKATWIAGRPQKDGKAAWNGFAKTTSGRREASV